MFTFQRAISQIVLEHDIPLDLVLNLGKYTFSSKGSTNVPINPIPGGGGGGVEQVEHLFFSDL